jgi:DNA-binding transcriptional MerR regulator
VAEPMNDQQNLISISELQDITKLPMSTLRFYETEFPSYLKVHKTSGGHRRYSHENVQRFLHLKHLIHEKGLSIREVKRSLAADEDPQKIREEMDLLLKVTEELTRENLMIRKSMEDLAQRLTALEDEFKKSKGGFKWFK